jgi:hypothetical protein
MAHFFHVQPHNFGHLNLSVSQSFNLATIFRKKIARAANGFLN